jgi:hypothetical protein
VLLEEVSQVQMMIIPLRVQVLPSDVKGQPVRLVTKSLKLVHTYGNTTKKEVGLKYIKFIYSEF